MSYETVTRRFDNSLFVELRRGTLVGILRDADLSVDNLRRLLD